jgi:ADP-ribose pyrophosphatase YjhB (NUDIX family)
MQQETTRVAAYGLLTKGAAILLCRISPAVEGFAGHWTLPGGGLDFGEDPQDAVVREVAEETGLEVVVKQLAGIDSRHIQQDNRDFHAIRIIYHVAYVTGELTYEQNGTTDRCEWVAKDDLNGLVLVDLAKVGLEMAFAV